MANVLSNCIREGVPFPRGAQWDGNGVNFSLFSANATKVEVCLFDEAGSNEIERIALPEYTDQILHGYLPDVGPGTVYGFASTALTSRWPGIASTQTNCSSIPMLVRIRGSSFGTPRVRLHHWLARMRI